MVDALEVVIIVGVFIAAVVASVLIVLVAVALARWAVGRLMEGGASDDRP